MELDEPRLIRVRKPGRPRAIPEELELVAVDLYRQGYGQKLE